MLGDDKLTKEGRTRLAHTFLFDLEKIIFHVIFYCSDYWKFNLDTSGYVKNQILAGSLNKALKVCRTDQLINRYY